jgi:hypothetical protein
MIQPRVWAFASLTSIHPESRVMTIGAASEAVRLAGAFCFPLCIDVAVEFVIAVYPSLFGLAV